MGLDRIDKKKVLLIGLGVSGRAAARYLTKKDCEVMAVERDRALIEKNGEIQELKAQGVLVSLETDLYSNNLPSNLQNIDLAVLSPGISSDHFLVQQMRAMGKEVIGEIELGCRELLEKSIPTLGITGTNGKTTTTFLVEHVLLESGVKARAAGNSGFALTNAIQEENFTGKLILELSSYQLETLRTPVLESAALLNITPDHLDRYPDMEAYAAAKCAIASCVKEGGKLFVEAKAAAQFGHLVQHADLRVYGYTEQAAIYTDLKSLFVDRQKVLEWPVMLQGRPSHDMENAMAAYALCAEHGVSPAQFGAALSTFKKPAHRIEFVAEKAGVRYYNDSKGTNLDAVIRAIETLDGPIILIAGGVDKGASYTAWLQPFLGRVNSICAIGQAAEKIRRELAHQIPVTIFSSLQEAVAAASKQAVSGQNVILSPGCSSYDMFDNYIDRGNQFKKAVAILGTNR